MAQFFWICLGGAIGTAARFLLSAWAAKTWGTALPYGTIAVNIIGSFLIALIMHAGITRGLLSPTARLTLTTGVMGGFTTYSSFNYETLQYFQQGSYGTGILNLLITVLGCLISAGLGLVFAPLVFGSGTR